MAYQSWENALETGVNFCRVNHVHQNNIDTNRRLNHPIEGGILTARLRHCRLCVAGSDATAVLFFHYKLTTGSGIWEWC
jgi:hypothetical protein